MPLTKYTIASLNRLITIRHINIGKNDKGVPLKLVASTQTTYAYFQQVSNNYTLQQAQVAFGELWEAIVRYEPNRIILPNDQILYNSQTFTINGIHRQDEGNLQWLNIRCTVNNKAGGTSGGEVMTGKKEIHVKGDVTIGGSEYANWAGSIIAFRDGAQFTVRRNGSAVDKEINYDASTGLFSFPVDLMPPQPYEPTDIYFL